MSAATDCPIKPLVPWRQNVVTIGMLLALVVGGATVLGVVLSTEKRIRVGVKTSIDRALQQHDNSANAHSDIRRNYVRYREVVQIRADLRTLGATLKRLETLILEALKKRGRK